MSKKTFTPGAIVAAVIIFAFAGCVQNNSHNTATPTATTTSTQTTAPTNPATPNETSAPADTNETAILSQLVEYTSQANPGPNQNYYWVAGEASIDGSGFPAPGVLTATSDTQGRASTAQATLTYQMYQDSSGSRQGDPLEPPTGWPSDNPKVGINYSLTGKTYHGYFWNRSHSISDGLAGAQSYSTVNNFTAGTRPQNVGANQNGGMRAPEEYAENYWKTHPNTDTVIYYQTIPVYQGNEIVPRGSIVNVKSSDNILNQQFIIINTAEGWTIDYNTSSIQQR